MIFNPWKKIEVKKLVNIYWIALALVIALGWYGLMYAIHGKASLAAFFNDQVGERFGKGIGGYVIDFFKAIGALFAYFIPWIFFPKRKRDDVGSEVKTQLLRFISLWVVMIVLFCAMVSFFYDRYLLQVVPLVAIALAILFLENKQFVSIKRTISILKEILIFIGSLAVISGVLFLARPVHWLLIIVFITGLFFVVKWKLNQSFMIPIMVVAIYTGTYLILAPIALPEIGNQIVSNLEKMNIHEATVIYKKKTAAKIRVAAGPGFIIREKEEIDQTIKTPMIIEARLLDKMDYNGSKIPIACTWSELRFSELVKARIKGKWNDPKDYYSAGYYLLGQ